MSSNNVLDEAKSSPAGPKSKKNKKKKSVKNKQVNGENTKLNGVKDEVQHEEEDGALETEMQSPTDHSTPPSPGALEKPNVDVLPNGKDEHGSTPLDDDDSVESSLLQQTPSRPQVQMEDAAETPTFPASNSSPQPIDDTDTRLARLHEEREALRIELAEVRRSLEALQERHEADAQEMQVQLTDANNKKEQAETQHRNLLGKVNTIRSQLGDRLKADAEELSQTRTRIEELEEQNSGLREENAAREAELATLADQGEQQSKELSSLRNRTTLSQQNFSKEREDLVQREAHAKEEFEAAKQAMQDWEILAMEERSIRESIAEKVADLEDQIAVHREAHERAASERDAQSNTVDGLQRALQELQEARRQELREVVENSQAQMERLSKEVGESERKAAEAIAELDVSKRDLERVLPFEKEVKEKNLLIGKLRHEGVILNEHLTKALRYTKNLKKGRPEDTIGK
ncbi:MAG: hypothetical protein OHK93_006509 [Ramalina farinacea]|uniref:Uncharacterized protein n=1 Tax=Ramalina farinacea TaxID=258253 RepID=A0AA43QIR8_9LECA|nr:hypothetical protein [Ramalina farinacea]